MNLRSATRNVGATVTLRQVSKTFRSSTGDVRALHDITLDIASESITAILGPSGCGKSTLLRMIAGLESPTRGDILINGMPPQEFRASGQLGIAFQDPALLPWRSVTRNVQLPLELLRRGPDGLDVRSLIADVKLAQFAAAKPSTLSGGMRERVSLARALVTHPTLLLLDEPFRSLDDVTRIQMNVLVERFWLEQRPSVILVTHSISDAIALADRIALFSPGPGATIVNIWNVDVERPRAQPVFSDKPLRDLQQQITTTVLEAAVQDEGAHAQQTT